MPKSNPSWSQKDVFPSVQQAIERLCKEKGEAVHAEIFNGLLKSPEAKSLIDSAVLKRPNSTRARVAGEMIAAFSQRHTLGGLPVDFQRRFNKRKTGHGAYTYYPVA